MLAFLFSNLAFGNGQSTHCWISEQAIQILPEGELREIMADPRFEQQWRNGTMFPDGGYAVDDGYGEISHWEPFQIDYLNWIKANYSQPWSLEAKQHIAFLMGLGSHGLADQSFDAMYFRRAYQYDQNGNWSESLDTATDVAFIAQTGAQPTPDSWIPMDAMLEIFAQQNYDVSPDTIEQGQTLLGVAIFWVGNASQNEEILTTQQSYYPWATSNLLNTDYSGSPPIEADIVAAYWRILWSQLHDEELEEQVLYAYPPAGTYEYPRDKDDIESNLSVVFAKGIDTSTLTENMFYVNDSDGFGHPIGIDVFYGSDSHVVNITPLVDWQEDTDYQLIITKDLSFRDGTSLGSDWKWSFSTKKAPEIPKTVPEVKTGCQADDNSKGCRAVEKRSHFPLILLGMIVFGLRRRND